MQTAEPQEAPTAAGGELQAGCWDVRSALLVSFCHLTSLGRIELTGSPAEFAALLQKAHLTVPG